MEKALFNGEVFIASEVAKSFELEKIIRQASGNHQLRCVDNNCHNPIVRYCRGEKKRAYFAHLDNSSCDYAQFDKVNNEIMCQARLDLYESFKSRGFDVQMEIKVLPKHYTHLLVTLMNGEQVAIEIGDRRTTAKHIEDLETKYADIGVKVKWVVIDEKKSIIKENDAFYLKRYALNKNKNNDVLIYQGEMGEITQYKEDLNKYYYGGRELKSKNYPEVFSKTTSINDLCFEDGELSIFDFYKEYEDWICKKVNAFNVKVKEMEKAAENSKELTSNTKVVESSNKKSHEELRQQIKPFLDQQEEPVKDEYGNRWIRCKICGLEETAEKFGIYGGVGSVNLGVCSSCERKKNGKRK